MVHQLETSNYSYMHTGKYVNYIQFVWTIATLYYSTLILGVFLLHQIAHVGVSKGIGLKLFGREKLLFSKNSNLCDHGT